MREFIKAVVEAQESFRSARRNRPFVCVTWAQSLDGMIAAAPGIRTTISGSDSMEMTHALRALHDGILVGIGTVLADDPRLSCRISSHTRNVLSEIAANYRRWPGKDLSEADLSPRAIVLDSRYRTPTSSRFLHQNQHRDTDRLPIIYGTEEACRAVSEGNLLSQYCVLEHSAIEKPNGTEENELNLHCRLSSVLEDLFKKDIKSVMVEGGASVISSFLRHKLCDLVVVTVAPTLFGTGLHISRTAEGRATIPLTAVQNSKWLQFGNDMVLIGTLTTV